MIDVVLCNTLYPPNGIGGSERSVAVLAKALAEQGLNVTVIAQSLGWRDRQRHDGPVKVIELGSPPGWEPNVYAHETAWRRRKRALFSKIRKPLENRYFEVIKAIRPALVHTNVVSNPHRLWRLLGQAKIPVVHTVRSYSLICDQRFFRRGQICGMHCDGCKLKFRDRITGSSRLAAAVGISHSVLQRHLDLGCFDRTPVKRVIPNSYRPENSLPVRSNDVDPLRIGFIGRIHPTKGLELVIEQLRRNASLDIRLLIAGTGNPQYVAQLKQSAPDKRIQFLGFVEPASFFRQIDVMVMPALWPEPFGRVSMEAICHGVPVLGSQRGGTPEIVVDGKCGFLWDVDAPDRLGALLRQINGDRQLLHTLSEGCIAEANRYDPGVVAKQYLDVYLEALS